MEVQAAIFFSHKAGEQCCEHKEPGNEGVNFMQIGGGAFVPLWRTEVSFFYSNLNGQHRM